MFNYKVLVTYLGISLNITFEFLNYVKIFVLHVGLIQHLKIVNHRGNILALHSFPHWSRVCNKILSKKYTPIVCWSYYTDMDWKKNPIYDKVDFFSQCSKIDQTISDHDRSWQDRLSVYWRVNKGQ